MMMRYVVALVLMLMAGQASAADTNKEQLWAALASGKAIAIMRHALAPGFGDPANFDVKDCSTQRNLSDEGRAQAERIGKLFREYGITQVRVVSSQWCRSLETARLLKLGEVEELTALNSFFANRANKQTQTDALKKWISEQAGDKPIVLVSHQVNISALTGASPASGEVVVLLKDNKGGFEVVGSLLPD